MGEQVEPIPTLARTIVIEPGPQARAAAGEHERAGRQRHQRRLHRADQPVFRVAAAREWLRLAPSAAIVLAECLAIGHVGSQTEDAHQPLILQTTDGLLARTLAARERAVLVRYD